ncbi:MAG: hypothetical protein WDM96_07380 [Lacunisphaera sp.]
MWLVLGVTLAGLLYVALARELPVPGFALRRIESELATVGLRPEIRPRPGSIPRARSCWRTCNCARGSSRIRC